MQNIIQRPGFFTSMDFTKGRVLRFYSLLILLFTVASVVISLPGAVRFAQLITSQAWKDNTEVILGLYPDELEVRVTNGTIATNSEEPISIVFPASWRTPENVPMPENLLVIDTTKSIALEDFAAKKTSFILGENSLGSWDPKEGKVSVYDLGNKGESASFIITKEKYRQFVTHMASVIQKSLLVGIFFLPIFFYIAYWVSYLMYLFIGAGIVLFVAKKRGYQLSYKNAYKAGIYLLPIPLVYDFFVMLLSDFPHARVPFLFTAFLIAMTLRNFPKQGSLDPVSSPVAVGNEVTSQPTDESPAEDLPVETGTSKTDASGV